jgi:Prokaryotic N-terminal methylation motif
LEVGVFNPAGRQPRRAASRRDSGITFIEILVAIVLVGTVVLAVLAATRTSIIASSTSREAADVESKVIAVADDIDRREQNCEETLEFRGDNVLEKIEHLTDAGWQVGACPAASGNPSLEPNLVQRFTVVVWSKDRSVSRSLQVVKGVPIQPAPLDAGDGGG